MEVRKVTDIIKINLNPRLESYFQKLLRFKAMHVIQVHESSEYEPLVYQTQTWSSLGVFYDYLIRKEIYNLLGLEAEDHRASIFEDELLDYEESLNDSGSNTSDGDSESEDGDEAEARVDSLYSHIDAEELRKPVASYQKYKDPKNASLDIIEDIFNTSMLHFLFFGRSMQPYDAKLLNMDNVKTVVKHVGTWALNKENVSLNPAVGGDYFKGDADLILDDVLVEIKVSKHFFKIKEARGKESFYQLFLYALGAFLNFGKEIRKFKIYNPLLGIEYFMQIPELDFTEFLQLVEEIKPL